MSHFEFRHRQLNRAWRKKVLLLNFRHKEARKQPLAKYFWLSGAAGILVALTSEFWGLGCPRIYDEVATRLLFINNLNA
ncbi:hypothetical protein BN59_03795 [Legionella massiliensis]|uniref:Uncharacterized protein n=1 Tax=Legionella massiliensis TaxID=1034943 RepID=A0A078L2N6_9GAMM|nr:hypothetical protein BN59_03795 [Legionella massiliensis]CEE15215.1 hypothetical protein BN1094_03795 [Legionella massiliensis]